MKQVILQITNTGKRRIVLQLRLGDSTELLTFEPGKQTQVTFDLDIPEDVQRKAAFDGACAASVVSTLLAAGELLYRVIQDAPPDAAVVQEAKTTKAAKVG